MIKTQTKAWKKRNNAQKNSLLIRLKQKYRRPLTLTGRYYRIARRMLVDKTNVLNAGFYWRSAMGKIWRTLEQYYDQHDFIRFTSQQIRVPYQVEQYLTFLYGRWKEPNKNHDPIKNDGSSYGELIEVQGSSTYPAGTV